MKNSLDQAHRPALIQPEALFEQLGRWDMRILDCRSTKEYERAHIPGALSVPAALLQDPDSERGELYPWDKLKSLLTSWGVSSKGPWLLYDDAGFVAAGRIFWVLEYFGVHNLSVLDGGWMIWNQNKYPIANESSKPIPGVFDSSINTQVFALRADVLKVLESNELNDPVTILVDTRTREEFQGLQVTALRNGHIPGAVHINWEENIEGLFTPKFKDLEDLFRLYGSQGVTPDKEVIVYCRTGSRSCQTFLTLKLLGFDRVRNYLGSWLDWGNDPELPVGR